MSNERSATRSSTLSRHPSIVLAIALLTPACGDGSEFYEDEAMYLNQPVQVDYEGYWQVIRGETSSRLPAKATGALLNEKLEGGQARATCGISFVSPHYAITAAHCVEEYALGEDFVVEQYRTADIDMNAVDAQAQVSGNWPNFQHNATLSTGNGYAVIEHEQCSVTRRCSFGAANCPGLGTVDIALVRCDDRPILSEHVKSENVQESGQDIEVFWAHEVVDLPTQDDGTQYWDNYGLRQSFLSNWHYTFDHQLLPLHSHEYPNGTNYNAEARGTVTFASDVPVCHGTSGSGVFLRDTSILLGPAVTAGVDSALGTRLCENMAAASPGEDLTRIVHSGHTSVLAAQAEVQLDRGVFAALASGLL